MYIWISVYIYIEREREGEREERERERERDTSTWIHSLEPMGACRLVGLSSTCHWVYNRTYGLPNWPYIG